MNNMSHRGAMLAHGLGSSIDGLKELPIPFALENLDSLQESFLELGRLVNYLSQIQHEQNEFFTEKETT